MSRIAVVDSATSANASGDTAQPVEDLIQIFGIAVRQLREVRGWSQEELAERSNLNRSYVGEVERGRVIASILTAQKLARALEIDIASLLTRCDQIERQRTVRRINLAAIAC
ncbi:multiprotein-bridging factor 1 family protein [Variovorax sp. N23]|uniref:helix-turn-helix domain-containing protein n=1 Tax=Variovorax sp. N23 TaxID=2980555 RepID=UPI0021C988EE|nr:helix-turn-helix transcriptional regulator [Variovorax sp. N23]MCU4120037.1 helix-turn-helix domain-containing protein [Variovorax sp. N23]